MVWKERKVESKKAFFKSSTRGDHKEQQALPLFRGIHQVQSMLLIVQFHG